MQNKSDADTQNNKISVCEVCVVARHLIIFPLWFLNWASHPLKHKHTFEKQNDFTEVMVSFYTSKHAHEGKISSRLFTKIVWF